MTADIVLQDPSYKRPVAVGPSFVVFRNRPGHIYTHEAHLRSYLGKILPPKEGYKSRQIISNQRALFFQSYVIAPPIPTHLLYSTLKDEWEASLDFYDTHRHSTIECIKHLDKDLVVFRSGQHNDCLTLLHSGYIQQPPPAAQPCFTLNVGQGAAVRHVKKAGTAQCNTQTILLSATSYELTVLQTERGSEEERDLSPHLHLLSPKQKFSFPSEILDLATSKGEMSFAYVLTKQGVYSWSPQLLSPLSYPPSLPPLYALSSSLHPKAYYALTSPAVYTVDTRAGREAQKLWGEGGRGTEERGEGGGEWGEVLPSSSSHFEVFLSTSAELLSLDTRYLRGALQRRVGGQGHGQRGERLSPLYSLSSLFSSLSPPSDLFASYSPYGGQSTVHILSPPSAMGWGESLRALSSLSPQSYRVWSSRGVGLGDGGEASTGTALLPLPPFPSSLSPSLSSVLMLQQDARGDVRGLELSLPVEGEERERGEMGERVQGLSPVGTLCLPPRPPRPVPVKISPKSIEERALGGLVARELVAPPDTSPLCTPLPSTAFLPLIPEDSLRGQDVVSFSPQLLRRGKALQPPSFYSLLPLPVPFCTPAQAEEVWGEQRERVLGQLETGGKTLFSLYTFFWEETGVRLSPPCLRGLLLAERVREHLLPRSDLGGDGLSLLFDTEVERYAEEREEIRREFGCVCVDLEGGEGGYGCVKRDCWLPHALLYTLPGEKRKAEGGGRRAGAGVTSAGTCRGGTGRGGGVSRELVQLLEEDWERD